MQNLVSSAMDVNCDMLFADYWINNCNIDANEVLKTWEEIVAGNENLLRMIPQHMVDIMAISATVSGEMVKALINRYESLSKQQFFIDCQPADKLCWHEILINVNLECIPRTVNVIHALATERCNLRSFPTNIFVSRELADYPLIDRLQETHLEPGQPLLVYHESADKLWCFAQIFNYCGWVEKTKIAVFSQPVWYEYCENCRKNFLVVTGKRLYIAESYVRGRKPLLFSMGACLPLWYGETKDIVDWQSVCGSYVAAMPRRNSDGFGTIEPLLIPVSSDINVGWLPLSTANLLRQAFKLQGERYGWGGLFESWDCSGLIMAVYSVFGILLPRNCAADEQPLALRFRLDFLEKDDIMCRLQKLALINPGGAVFTDGHVMMYLGKIDDKHYVIHSTNGGRDSHGNVLNCVLVASLHERSTSGKSRLIERVYAAGNY